jgi:hypothetical protein
LKAAAVAFNITPQFFPSSAFAPRTSAEVEHRIAFLRRERWAENRISAATGLSRPPSVAFCAG